MRKTRILFHSNYSRMVTGFGKNLKNILLKFYNDPNYEIAEAANGAPFGADLKTPWKSYGTISQDPAVLNFVGNDPNKQRAAAYGGFAIDQIIEDFKPDVYVGIEDIWAFKEYQTKPWWPKIKTVLWTTLDSLPILEDAFELAPHCDKMLVWASFAEKAMREAGYNNVETLHGAVDYSHFFPLPQEEKKKLRQQLGLVDDFIIGFVFKNQLRKSVPNLLDGFRLFQQQSKKKCKLLLHTDWSEKGSGWDIPRYLKEKKINPDDVLATYVCHACDSFYISKYQGEDKNCPFCNGQKTFKTKNSAKGVSEEQLNLVYNCMDVYCHPFTSGGQELPVQEAKAAGLVTLVTEYSCGTDSCYPHQGGLPLKWNEYREPYTQFIKATTSPESICDQLINFVNMSPQDRDSLAFNGMKYVQANYNVDTIVNKLKEIIKTIPDKPIKEEGATQQPPVTLESLLDPSDAGRRILVSMPNDAIDVIMMNGLLSNIKTNYPNYEIYVATHPQFFPLIEDHPDVKRVFQHLPFMDDVLLLEGKNENLGLFQIVFAPHLSIRSAPNYHHNGLDKTQFSLA